MAVSTSARFQFDGVDFEKIGKGSLIAIVGAWIGYLSGEVIPSIQGESTTQLAVAAIASFLVNFGRKWLADNRDQKTKAVDDVAKIDKDIAELEAGLRILRSEKSAVLKESGHAE